MTRSFRTGVLVGAVGMIVVAMALMGGSWLLNPGPAKTRPPLVSDLPAKIDETTPAFAERIKARFPIGSDEAALIQQLKAEAFQPEWILPRHPLDRPHSDDLPPAPLEDTRPRRGGQQLCPEAESKGGAVQSEPGPEHLLLEPQEGEPVGLVHPHRTAEDHQERGARIRLWIRRPEALHRPEPGAFQGLPEAS